MAKNKKNISDPFTAALNTAESYYEKSLTSIIAQPLSNRQSAFYNWLNNTQTKTSAQNYPEGYLSYAHDMIAVSGANKKAESTNALINHEVTKCAVKTLLKSRPLLEFEAATHTLPEAYILQVMDETDAENNIVQYKGAPSASF